MASSPVKVLVGDLPAYGGLGEGGFGGDLAGGGAGHVREGGLDLFAESPDGDFLHGVAVADGGFFESVNNGDGGGAVDAGDLAMAVAEADFTRHLEHPLIVCDERACERQALSRARRNPLK